MPRAGRSSPPGPATKPQTSLFRVLKGRDRHLMPATDRAVRTGPTLGSPGRQPGQSVGAGMLDSVPARYAGRRLPVRLAARTVEIYDGPTLVAHHERTVGRYVEVLTLGHYLEALKIKPRRATRGLWPSPRPGPDRRSPPRTRPTGTGYWPSSLDETQSTPCEAPPCLTRQICEPAGQVPISGLTQLAGGNGSARR